MKDQMWNSIKCKGLIPSGRSSQACTMLGKDKIFLFGGYNNLNELFDAYILDLSNINLINRYKEVEKD